MAHFRCPTSSIVGSTDRYYSNGDSFQYSNNSTSSSTQTSSSAYMDDDLIDLFSSGDESASSSSSSTILASRTMNRSSTRKTTSHRRRCSTKAKTPVSATHLFGQQTAASSSRPTTQSAKPLLSSSTATNELVSLSDQDTDQDRQCWICYGDDNDSEGNWVSPCPCSLVVHEKCLLDWITENQKGSPRKLVQCPQCASTYHLVEKSNWLLSFFGVIDEVVHTIAPYITSLGLGLSLLVVTTTYGASSVILLFGTRESERILGPPSFWTWRTWVGLPSIPLALLSTRSRIADSFLPFFTFLVLRLSSTASPSSSSLSPLSSLPYIQFSWPPTPLATLGILPWVRLAYNNIYYAAQGLISRQLSLKMVRDQHRRQRSNNNNQLDLMTDVTTNDHTVDPTTAATMSTIEQQSPERSTELDILLGRGPPSVGMLFMSTLLWPVVGNITGSCISQVGWIRQRLPEPFHRNILGGCLFVVIKDVGNLLYRYQKVRQYRSRRIQNYNEIKRNS